ncbi:hypothetical protein CYMTET_3321 [Cymbomonas tetramitiformis]|uniref:Uncharacterized protein n=1 Tax=Cymbomonas tetramitiformis TaxID=36881 RepID=A0AAE0H3Y1_9CHLO|nr:hypothetical protein CYMTET_3321 [Cymbomonas tetramitiformis]
MIQLCASIESDATVHGGSELAFVEETVYAGTEGLVTDFVFIRSLQELHTTKAKAVMNMHAKANAKILTPYDRKGGRDKGIANCGAGSEESGCSARKGWKGCGAEGAHGAQLVRRCMFMQTTAALLDVSLQFLELVSPPVLQLQFLGLVPPSVLQLYSLGLVPLRSSSSVPLFSFSAPVFLDELGKQGEQLEALATGVVILPRCRDLFTPSDMGASELLRGRKVGQRHVPHYRLPLSAHQQQVRRASEEAPRMVLPWAVMEMVGEVGEEEDLATVGLEVDLEVVVLEEVEGLEGRGDGDGTYSGGVVMGVAVVIGELVGTVVVGGGGGGCGGW